MTFMVVIELTDIHEPQALAFNTTDLTPHHWILLGMLQAEDGSDSS